MSEGVSQQAPGVGGNHRLHPVMDEGFLSYLNSYVRYKKINKKKKKLFMILSDVQQTGLFWYRSASASSFSVVPSGLESEVEHVGGCGSCQVTIVSLWQDVNAAAAADLNPRLRPWDQPSPSSLHYTYSPPRLKLYSSQRRSNRSPWHQQVSTYGMKLENKQSVPFTLAQSSLDKNTLPKLVLGYMVD